MSPKDAPELVPIPNADGSPMLLGEMEAIELSALLEANEIDCVVDEVEMLPSLPSRLLVTADALERAIEIIIEAREAGEQGAEEASAAGEQ